MKLSTKGRYAMVALADLALAKEGDLMTLAHIAERQEYFPALSGTAFCQNCAVQVWSRRCAGQAVGIGWPCRLMRFAYPKCLRRLKKLSTPCHQGAGASGGVSGTRAQSMTNRLWEGLSAQVYVYLHQARLSDVVGNALAPCPAVPALFRVVDE